MPDLVAPTTAVRASFLAAVEELVAEGRTGEGSMLKRWMDLFSDRWHAEEGFAEFVAYLHADARPASERPTGHVPQSTWWLVDDDTYLGRISVRHELTDWLREYGGHIGYEVRPSARRRGHATEMLRSVLPHAHALGIESALLTCDEDNLASAKVIEAAGGVLEGRRGIKLRYWVPTAEMSTTDVENGSSAPFPS
ncbi:GNAT family N-acetyltransferase [Nocardioides sp. P5_C9_2]